MLRNKLYYLVKPALPVSLRLAVRRQFALRKRQLASRTWPILEGSESPPADWPGWPGGKQFAVVLSHDVEGQSGVNKCRDLMTTEWRHGFRSSFNFIPEGTYRVSEELRRQLVSTGFEVGVHDLNHDGKLYSSRTAFAEKAGRINGYLRDWGAVGFRSGFMLHNLDWLGDLDVLYDASTFDTDPFEPQPDGANTIFPFEVRLPGRKGYVELPYTLPQDSTLFLLFREQSAATWIRKLDWVAEHGGMALVNVHPDYIRFPGEAQSRLTFPVEIYEEFLRYVSERYAGRYWHALPREVAGYYRDAMHPVPAIKEKPGLLATAAA